MSTSQVLLYSKGVPCSESDIASGSVVQMYLPFQSSKCDGVSTLVGLQTTRNVLDFSCCSSDLCNRDTLTTAAAIATTAPAVTSPSPAPCDGPVCTLGGSRPAPALIPPSYQPGTPAPLVLFLEGYFPVSGAAYAEYFHLPELAAARGAVLVVPDGTLDKSGFRFWNAPAGACCNFFGSRVDDLAYLAGLLAEARARLSIDPARVYVVGHSNGGFMAYALACRLSGQIAAAVVFAGAMPDSPCDCPAAGPVSVLHIHGTADATILFEGSVLPTGPYPSALTSVADWARADNCSAAPPPAGDGFAFAGGVTTPYAARGCPPGVRVELWVNQGGRHAPNLTLADTGRVFDWLLAARKVHTHAHARTRTHTRTHARACARAHTNIHTHWPPERCTRGRCAAAPKPACRGDVGCGRGSGNAVAFILAPAGPEPARIVRSARCRPPARRRRRWRARRCRAPAPARRRRRRRRCSAWWGVPRRARGRCPSKRRPPPRSSSERAGLRLGP